MKKGAEDSRGMPQELVAIATHEMRRMSAQIWQDVTFVSDDELAKQLAKFLYNAPMSVNRALRDYAGVALGNCMQVFVFYGYALHNTSNLTVEIALASDSFGIPTEFWTHRYTSNQGSEWTLFPSESFLKACHWLKDSARSKTKTSKMDLQVTI